MVLLIVVGGEGRGGGEDDSDLGVGGGGGEADSDLVILFWAFFTADLASHPYLCYLLFI